MNAEFMKIRARKLARNKHVQGALLATSVIYLYYKRLEDDGYKLARLYLNEDTDDVYTINPRGKTFKVVFPEQTE